MRENQEHNPQDNLRNIRSAMGRAPIRPRTIETAQDPQKALTRLAGYLRPYTPTLILVFLFVLAYILLGLLEPYLIGDAIDQFIDAKDGEGLARNALILLVVFIFDQILQAVSSWLMANISQDALKQIRQQLFSHLQSLSLSFFDSRTPGELMSRLTNDIDAINQAVSQNVVSLFASTLSMVGILITMFILNAWLALVSVVVVPIMLWFANFISRYTRKGFQNLQRNLGQLNSVMEETISGQRVVKAFGRSQNAVENFRTHNQEVYRAGIFANSYAMALMPLTNVLGNLFVILLVGLGGWLTLQELATVGMITAFITYGRNFIHPLRQLANLYNAIQAALAGAERVFEVLDTPSEVDAPKSAQSYTFKGEVKFDRVTFGYAADVPVIKNMSLEARAGQTVALVGPTGAGKTTLINLLMRFYEPDSGLITIDGQDLREVPKSDLRRKLGLVLQDTYLFSNTVMENIRYGRLGATDEEVIQAAHLADADHFIRQLPQGYETILSERASNLSQGQRQMLSIARAILADPSILILDEATSSVDTRTESRIQQALLRLMEGRTSFVIAHRLSTIRDADNLIVINEGEIVEQGSHDQLLAKKGFYYELYLSQFKGITI